MKKNLLCLAAVSILAVMGLASCGESGEQSTTLTLYTSTSEDNVKIMIPKFEEETGIHIEYIYGKTATIVSRITAEKDNPQADVVWLPTQYIEQNSDCYDSYIAENEKNKPEEYQSKTGFASVTNYSIPMLIYNKTLVKGELKGYADLLSSELTGKMAFGDATTSSSAYNHLENMLLDYGKGDTIAEKLMDYDAWTYVDSFYKNLDKKIVSSSATTLTGVVSGEYAVGLSWDTKGYEALSGQISDPNGTYKDIGISFMEEGVVPKTSGVGIIKNAKNNDNAKKFVDYMSSVKGQNILGTDIAGTNPIVKGSTVSSYKKSIDDLKTFSITTEESNTNKPKVIERYKEIVQKYSA